MTLLLQVALTNAVMATVLGLVAAVVGGVCRRPALGHCLWLLVSLKLITPPLLLLPIPSVTLPSITLGSEPATNDSSPREAHGPGAQSRDARPPAISEAVTAWIPWVSSVWLTGSVLWFATAVFRIRRFQLFLRNATPAPSELQERARELSGRLGVTRCPRVCVVPLPVSPLLWGISPSVRVVLPAELLRCLEPEEQDALLAHVLAHLRRHDNCVRLLELTAIGLFWWHPLVWWARREIGRAEEYCCDSWVVWLLPGAALAYAIALLKTVEFLSEGRPIFIPATSGAGRLPILKSRLTKILRESRCHRLSRPAGAAALLIGLILLPVAPGRPVASLGETRPAREKEDVFQVGAGAARGLANDSAQLDKVALEKDIHEALDNASKEQLVKAALRLGNKEALLPALSVANVPAKHNKVVLEKEIQEALVNLSKEPSVKAALGLGIKEALLPALSAANVPAQHDKVVLEKEIQEALDNASKEQLVKAALGLGNKEALLAALSSANDSKREEKARERVNED